MTWRKSSFSGSNGGNRVAVAGTLGAVHDSKNPTDRPRGPVDQPVESCAA
ncbi:DUF397 domain-containing protein [Actinophytocola glycyrrhizae]|uniref:DUF397 domain-containing protein n=1 Tax=Actinophytocola glycyrrhizae TaxID=2044873 RepID=A0ABV9S099_9PSEU